MGKRECTDGEWPCERSTHLASLESENLLLENENVLLKSVIDKWKHLDDATAMVKSWPEWKKKICGIES